MKKRYGRAFKRGFLLGITLILLAIVAVGIMIYPTYDEYTSEAKNAIIEGGEDIFYSTLTSYIYDDSQNVLKKLKKDKDTTYLDYENIPKNAINAFIAIEDRTFWTNPGVDLKGIIRVIKNYILSAGEEKHGASTITQQLVRNIYISSEVTMDRKIKEICYALELTKRFSKSKIIEYYINNIYYANGYYGLEAASNGYFGLPSSEISLSQMAYICAIPNSPTYYDPINNPQNALERRNKILKDMLEMDYISQSEYNQAVNEKITLNVTSATESNSYGVSYAIDCATRYLMKENGFEFKYVFDSKADYQEYLIMYNEMYDSIRNELYTGGYRIYTTLNSEKQNTLQESVDTALSFNEDKNADGIYDLQGSATCIDNETGKVVAIIGGRSQDVATYLNRAYQGYRQPGSSIKPLIVYTPALEMGYGASSVINNLDISAWQADGTVTGTPIVLREAVEQSINGAAWGLILEITPKTAVSYLQNMKFAKIVPDDYYASSSLGGLTYGTTTVEMASAYSCLVNHGEYTEPTCISSIIDKDGNEIYKDAQKQRVYTENASNGMIDILKGVITNGTASKIGWSSATSAAGKTGTTNDNKDGWFCGVTPYYTISVWVGYDSPKTLSGLYGSSYPLKIWNTAMTDFISDLPAKTFDGEYIEENILSNFDDATDNDMMLMNDINGIIDNMYAINKADPNWPAYANSMYDNAMIKVNQITSESLRQEMEEKLNTAQGAVFN